MRRQGNETSPSIIHTSSIALLQERFRNLQRVKEMREGRELQRVQPADHVAGPAPLNPGLQAAAGGGEQPSRWFLHPDLVRPSRPLQGPAFHGLAAASGAAQLASPAPPPASSWRDAPRTMQNSGYRGDVDVDTSLHL